MTIILYTIGLGLIVAGSLVDLWILIASVRLVMAYNPQLRTSELYLHTARLTDPVVRRPQQVLMRIGGHEVSFWWAWLLVLALAFVTRMLCYYAASRFL